MNAWHQWVQRPQNLWVRKALFQVHLWIGIGIGLYVFLISLSGTAIIYRPQIEKAYGRQEVPLTNVGSKLSEPQLTEYALRAYPNYEVADIYASRRADKPSTVILKQGEERFSRLFNPYTGEDLGDPRSATEQVVEWLVNFHDNLLSGTTGRFWNGIASILVTLVALTGAVLWWPGIRNWKRSTGVNWKASFPLFNWSLHSAIGFWFFLFVLMWGVSGIYFTFPKPFSALFGDGDFLVWFVRVHFGRFGRIGRQTLFNKTLSVLWLFFGLVPAGLVVTGFCMWWNRVLRKKRVEIIPASERASIDTVPIG